MNGRNAPLSPVSLGDSEWPTVALTDRDGPYPTPRGLISPPNSGSSVGAMNGFPPGPRSTGGPSPPPSMGRSGAGTTLCARSESGRSGVDQNTEAILGEHYVALKRFLAQAARNDKGPPANKGRDKLQRLTSVQFLELSTDVFDELMRRQAYSRRPPNAPPNIGPPSFLLPEETFHPKRNQARQKLSSLGAPRFRDLVTDVFCELERRFPRFSAGDIPRMGSPSSLRAPSRVGTPVGGYRSQARRRPSEAGSVRSMRSGVGSMGMGSAYGTVPPSPGIPPNNYDRPLQKQSQSNTIVPNKSTMVEEDDDITSPLSEANDGAFGMGDRLNGNRQRSGETDKSAVQSENDKRLIEDYENQVRDLREKLETMEDVMKKKDDEMNSILDGERSRSTAVNVKEQEFKTVTTNLENQLADARDLNDNLQAELDRLQDDHAAETRQLREEMDLLGRNPVSVPDPNLQQENADLHMRLREQEDINEEVRRMMEESLAEMRILSQQSSASYDRQSELEKANETLENEVRDWRNRYARTKTQLRNMRATSMGLTIEQDAGKYVRERGFTADNGLVKDVHVTNFQISIDELLHRARVEDPDKAIDSVKAVIVSVRRITQDIDESPLANEETARLQGKLKARVSSTANNLITAAKNFGASAGISPVSLVDAAASHLVAAVVELLRTVKIRATPAGELEDDDDGTMTPVDAGPNYFPPGTNGVAAKPAMLMENALPPPPPFTGLGKRDSEASSAYSPVNSPRQSADPYNARRPSSRGQGLNGNLMNGNGNNSYGKPPTNGCGPSAVDRQAEDLKIYLEDQTAVMVESIQSLVGSIRSDGPIEQISAQINDIANIVGRVIAETEASGNGGNQLDRLTQCRQRLLESGDRGEDLAADGMGPKDREWRMWTQTLPPIAFEIARESKELVQRIDRLVGGGRDDDFS